MWWWLVRRPNHSHKALNKRSKKYHPSIFLFIHVGYVRTFQNTWFALRLKGYNISDMDLQINQIRNLLPIEIEIGIVILEILFSPSFSVLHLVHTTPTSHSLHVFAEGKKRKEEKAHVNTITAIHYKNRWTKWTRLECKFLCSRGALFFPFPPQITPPPLALPLHKTWVGQWIVRVGSASHILLFFLGSFWLSKKIKDVSVWFAI